MSERDGLVAEASKPLRFLAAALRLNGHVWWQPPLRECHGPATEEIRRERVQLFLIAENRITVTACAPLTSRL